MSKEVHIYVDNPFNAAAAEFLRHELKAKFGHYAIKSFFDHDMETVSDQSAIAVQASDIPMEPNERTAFIADLVSLNLVLESDDLSCRPDHSMLDKYRGQDGVINLVEDPRDWIRSNPLINDLVQQDRYSNLIDYVTEQRGLFIKPAQYANQRNYWNSSTNAGLPIVKKRDPIHEGTFMLHDLFHFSIQDPVPVALETSNIDMARKTYLMHRMASESTTLVLADMLAVDDLKLEERGYDVDKRGIYPIYRDIISSNGAVDIETVLRANLAFCFTGSIDDFEALGARPETLERFKNKYEVFFSADFDWNLANFDYVNSRLTQRPELTAYYNEVQDIFGVPTIDILYPDPGLVTVDQIGRSFSDQINRGFAYQADNNNLTRLKRSASKYHAGQLMIFYNYPNTALKSRFLEIAQRVIEADTIEAAMASTSLANDIVVSYLAYLRDGNVITSQDYELFKMHYPLYPAHFLHYDADADKYKNLSEKIKDLGL